MLPIAYGIAYGSVSTIVFDSHQKVEILMTIGQSLLGVLLLANMRFAWWEAAVLFLLWVVQFVLSGFEKPLEPGAHNSLALQLASWISVGVEQIEGLARVGKEVITYIYFVWSAIIIVMAFKRRSFEAITVFPRLMREHW